MSYLSLSEMTMWQKLVAPRVEVCRKKQLGAFRGSILGHLGHQVRRSTANAHSPESQTTTICRLLRNSGSRVSFFIQLSRIVYDGSYVGLARTVSKTSGRHSDVVVVVVVVVFVGAVTVIASVANC